MKLIRTMLGTVFSVSLIIALMFTSIQFVAYWLPGYFDREFEKYGVYEAVKTEPDEMRRVADEMMDYLIGDRDSMSDITATVDGVPNTKFFNERECAHMADVRVLFLGGVNLRKKCLILCAIILGVLLLLSGVKKTKDALASGMIAGTGVFVAAIAALAVMLAQDFNKYFTIFHKIFFNNDLWLFDPRTSRLINMLPEGFFMDTARNIVLTFAIALVVLLAVSIKHEKKRKNN